MIFTDQDIQLVADCALSLEQTLGERRASGQYYHENVDAKIARLRALGAKMREANVREQAHESGVVAARAVASKIHEQIERERDEARAKTDAAMRRLDETIARAQAAEQRAPYNPEPDRLLDYIEREPWADVRLAICPDARREHGNLRDAIRYAIKTSHAGRR